MDNLVATEKGVENLSKDDITALINNPDADTKIRVIEKISDQYSSAKFSKSQSELAEQIFRLLCQQAEVEVRKALSENLMSNTSIPHDIVLSLARDVEEVSAPVLEFSEILTEQDLLEIIQSTEKKQILMSVSSRSTVQESVSDALVDKKVEDVTGNLIKNDGARIAQQTFEKAIQDNSDSEEIAEAILKRATVPTKVIELMTRTVSAAISKKLESKYKKSFKEINQFFKESAEVAALKFQESKPIDDDLIKVVDDLEERGLLEDALHPMHGMLTQLLDGLEQMGHVSPIAALQRGHLTLFEVMLARATSVPITNVHKLVVDTEGGLRALYERAQLPANIYDAVRFITTIILRINDEARKNKKPLSHNNLTLLIKYIVQASHGTNIPGLAKFVERMRENVERTQSEW